MKRSIHIGDARVAHNAAETYDDALTAVVDYAAERFGHLYRDGRNLVAVRVASSDRLAQEHGHASFDGLAATVREDGEGLARRFVFDPA